MTLSIKEITTIELLNKKGLVYEYVEVQALGLGGVIKTVNKLVKINAKKKKFNPVMKMVAESREMTSVEAQDVFESSIKRQMKNI
jgi:hypothetical protein